MLRLNKYLSEAGVCSRREADRLIEQGRVKVDGTPATVGMQVDEHAQITVDGKAVGEKKVRSEIEGGMSATEAFKVFGIL